MFGVVANLILNILIVFLLAATIAYCWMLNRRIKIIQDSRGELAKLLKHFDESTQRASESIIALQTASKKIGENIQFRIDKANYLIDDLSFMIDKGNKLANQMEAGFAVNRARDRVMSEQHPIEPEPDMRAQPLQPPPKVEAKLQSIRDKTSASLEAVLGRVVGRSAKQQAEEPIENDTPARGNGANKQRSRSRSEQELLDLIKAGIKG